MISAAEPHIYRVAELARKIRSVLEEEMGTVWLEGEVSNLRRPASGHVYFTLKDDQAQISTVLFRGVQRGSPIELRDGLFLRVQGDISVYERSGSVQLVIRKMQAAGIGALQEAFEKLKKKLQAEGLFDRPKRPIPALPRCVGLVTSPTGAAIRDIFHVIHRRFPNLHLVLAPVRVQGEGSAIEISDAIDLFNDWGVAEVLIVGRGGGSQEDLWAFNEEIVARAIARSRIPVISAVGHEIDTTISDWVADVRASTPSVAAEMVVGQKEEFEQRVQAASRALVRGLRSHCLESRNRWATLASNRVFHEPAALVGRQRERVEGLRLRRIRALCVRTRQIQQTVDDVQLQLRKAVEWNRKGVAETLGRLDVQLRALNPLDVLKRGFSLTRLPDGRLARDAREVQPGLTLRTRLASGEVESKVTDIQV